MDRELSDIIKTLKSVIEVEKGFGITEFLMPEKPNPAKKGSGPSGASNLESLEMDVLSCKKCQLHKRRNNAVFGVGNPRARLMFVGEGPGYEEDMQGLPFVGRAGKLLTKMIEAMGLERKDVYIANVVKCRPPDNRNPLPAEMIACEGYLAGQIDTIKPEVICTLGKIASQALLKTEVPIGRLRGEFHAYRGIKLMPTYHPAYLLRNPGDKRLAWNDLKKIMALLGL